MHYLSVIFCENFNVLMVTKRRLVKTPTSQSYVLSSFMTESAGYTSIHGHPIRHKSARRAFG